jgi:BASS family bile acid:Na+ symporter
MVRLLNRSRATGKGPDDVDLAIQIAVFLIMVIVGLDLTRADFGRLTERPALVVVATVAQWTLLPLVAWAVAWVLPLPPHVVAGIVLLAACPAGAISNYYSFIARADVALSVTLTAISVAASVVTLPLISAVGFNLLLDEGTRVVAPIGPMAIQLVANLLIPVLIGMWLRARFPEFVTRHQPVARRLGNVALVTTVAILLFGLGRSVLEDLGATIVSAIVFTVVAAGAGLIVGAALRADRRQLQSLAIEFACRNTAITILIGIVVLDRPELAVFGLVVFLTQMPLVLGGVAIANGLIRE